MFGCHAFFGQWRLIHWYPPTVNPRSAIEVRSREGRMMGRNVLIITAVIYSFFLASKSGNLSDLDKTYADQA